MTTLNMLAAGMVASPTEFIVFMFTSVFVSRGLVPARQMAMSMAVNEKAILSESLRGLARLFHPRDLRDTIKVEVNEFPAPADLTIGQERLP